MIPVILATVAAVPFVLEAAAEDVGPVVVRYGDLNLSSPSDAAELKQRIAHAAEQICDRNFPVEASLRSLARRDYCVRDARDRALDEVQWPSQ